MSQYISEANNNFMNEEFTYYCDALRLPREKRPQLLLTVAPEMFSLADPKFDDAYAIDMAASDVVKLSITGSNTRSCLLGLYRFFYEIGVRFPRPGRVWDIIPRKVMLPDSLSITEKASSRYRGVCIEGANSIENILDFIDWLPKVGYNSFFMQFFYPYDFFRKWYDHVNNKLLTPENYTLNDFLLFDGTLSDAMQLRGISHQRVGHGWTAKALGYDGLSWEAAESVAIAETTRDIMAEIGGQRGLFRNRPLLTNLCLSKSAARQLFVQEVVVYAEAHPHVDVLHVWLSDAANAICECSECQETTPSDQYIQLLNEIDEALAKQNINTRICFLNYLELLWPPQTETLRNKDRFVMMFAPISRTFESSMKSVGYPPAIAIPEYKRNHITLPVDLSENLVFLHGWQEHETVDSFIYDYPMGRAHYGDLGYMKIAKILAEDIEALPMLGLNGYISCQEERVALPSALPNYVMGMKLWHHERSFDDLANDYFESIYGRDGQEIRHYLEELSACSNSDYTNGKLPRLQPDLAKKFRQGYESAEKLQTMLASILGESLELVKRNYVQELHYYSGYAVRLFAALADLAEGLDQEVEIKWDELCRYVRLGENQYQSSMDVYRIMEVMHNYTGFPRLDE